MIVYYSSSSENTVRFVDKLGLPSKRIINKDPIMVDEPFILITPTFADAFGRNPVPKPVINFLNQETHRKNMVGVVGTGNRNFGGFFALGGKVVAKKCNSPLLHTMELSGFNSDEIIVRNHYFNMIDCEDVAYANAR